MLYRPALIALAVLLLTGCTTQMVYNTGQGWQKQQCLKIVDREERTRCEKSTAMSYEKYRTEVESASRKQSP